MGIIYKATNTINGKIYIGQTINGLDKRKSAHENIAINRNSPLVFHKALRKYGIKNFEWEIIEECENELLSMREIYYIDFYKTNMCIIKGNGYNMTNGGDGGGNLIEHHPNKLEIYESISKSFMGEKNHFYGKKHTDETKLKMSINGKGKITGEKNPNYGKKGESNHTSKKYVITLKNGYDFFVHGVDEFCDWYKETFSIILQPQNISLTAKGKNKHHKGLLVRFYDLEKDYDVKYWKDVLEEIKKENINA